MKREKAEANKNNVPATIEEIVDFNTIFEVKKEVDAPEEIICMVTGGTVLVAGLMMVLVLMTTTFVGVREILRLKPKEILI